VVQVQLVPLELELLPLVLVLPQWPPLRFLLPQALRRAIH
jgi:hypothetical protein